MRGTNQSSARRPAALVSILLAMALLAAACGGNGTGASDSAASPGATDADGDASTATDAGAGSDVEYEPVQLDMASFLAPTTGQGGAITRWIEELESRTDGAVTVETFWNQELLAAQEIKDGVRDGRVQLGNMTYAYTPSDFPLTQIVEVPFLGSNIGAQIAAMNGLYENNDDFRNEWESQGIKVMSFVGIPPALTGAPEPVTTVDWFRGKTVRASGFYVKALEAVGANPAAIPVPEVYEAMQRGTIDAYGSLILDVITPLSLHEVGPHIHDAGLGHFANSTWTMSLDTWNSLQPELQSLIEELNDELPGWLLESAASTEDAACIEILDAGGSVHIFSEEETAKWREAIGEEPRQEWATQAEAAGVEDGLAMYEEFEGYYNDAEANQYSDYEDPMERCVAEQESRG